LPFFIDLIFRINDRRTKQDKNKIKIARVSKYALWYVAKCIIQ
jgi:hypothetical protein